MRESDFDINPLIIKRWSPRSLTGEIISDDDLFSLFEAARWAPSAFNNQPWRIIYAKRNTSHWNNLFSLLDDFNKGWAKNASALVVLLSHKTFEHNGKPSFTHQFDAGAAWENMAIEATSRGLVAHAMEGFNYKKAKKILDVPDEYEVMIMIAIGKQGKKEILSPQLQKRESPTPRKPLTDIMMEGKFS